MQMHICVWALEYVGHTEGSTLMWSCILDRYVGDGEQAHLLSVFGADQRSVRSARPSKGTHSL